MHKSTAKRTKIMLATGLSVALCMAQPLFCLTTTAAPDPGLNADSNANAGLNAATEDPPATAIPISTADDLISFAQSCTVDTWSVGKVFVLNADINLSGTDFTSIPTFGGTFLGQGHTISGLSINGGSNNTALFRYIQESGEIYQL